MQLEWYVALMLGQTRNISSWKITTAAASVAAAAAPRSAAPAGSILPGRTRVAGAERMSSPGTAGRSAGGFSWTIPITLLQKKQRSAPFCSVRDVKPVLFSMQVRNKVSCSHRVFFFSPFLFFPPFIKYVPWPDSHRRLIRKYAELLPGFNVESY